MAEEIKIACMGDTMPGGILHYETGDNFCSSDIFALLRDADLRVATLETAIGDEPLFDEEKMKRDKDVIYCPTADLRRLSTLGINVVSLANNHAWDLGFAGVRNAQKELDRLGIKYCGAGANLDEASRPAVLEVKGRRLAFIAYCDNAPGTCGYVPAAKTNTPGINVIDENSIRESVSSLKKKYDYLFVMMHWGKEYYCYPLPSVCALARRIIDWGADGVIGSHSHQVQPTIFHKGKPIIFSLGNFLFPDRFITRPRSTYYPPYISSIADYPSTEGYPFVEKPTFKKWKKAARAGKITTLTLGGNSIGAQTTFTALDETSHIAVSGKKAPLLYGVSRTLVRLPFYGAAFFVCACFRVVNKKLKGEL